MKKIIFIMLFMLLFLVACNTSVQKEENNKEENIEEQEEKQEQEETEEEKEEEKIEEKEEEMKKESDTIIVVLGNWMNDNGTISTIMRRRLDLAIKAYEEFNPKYIVVTGGMANAKAGIAEADAMYNYLVDAGIDKDIIIKEDQSMSTYQNANYTIKLIEDIDFKNLIIVSTIEHFINYDTIKYFNDACLNNPKMFSKKINIMIYTNNTYV